MSKKIIYKSFTDKKKFNQFLKTAGKTKQEYELRFKGKKFRLGTKRKETIKHAKTYAKVAASKNPEQYIENYLKGLKNDSVVTVKVSTKDGMLYIRKLHRVNYKTKQSRDAYADLMDEVLHEIYDIDNSNIVSITSKKIELKR